VDPTALDLDDQARLLGGATTWRTHASADGTIPALKMSDGPNGVRGEAEDDGLVPGVVVPVGIALGATWNPALVGAIGDLLGTEAIRRGAHVLLGPTVNIQRLPIGGRVFECFAEDPELTAALAVAFVRGVQAHEVAVTVKHLVGNDTEIERGTVDVRMSETALREIYLRPFEATVTEADAWGMMSAYNRLDGEHCAENRRLLTEILRDEWGFDGFVVSDWDPARSTGRRSPPR
jgi:beta-glucosidase